MTKDQLYRGYLSMCFTTKKALELVNDAEEYARDQALAFAIFRDNFQREERKRVREEEKRLGGMITWIGRSDEEIYAQFIESQNNNTK